MIQRTGIVFFNDVIFSICKIPYSVLYGCKKLVLCDIGRFYTMLRERLYHFVLRYERIGSFCNGAYFLCVFSRIIASVFQSKASILDPVRILGQNAGRSVTAIYFSRIIFAFSFVQKIYCGKYIPSTCIESRAHIETSMYTPLIIGVIARALFAVLMPITVFPFRHCCTGQQAERRQKSEYECPYSLRSLHFYPPLFALSIYKYYLAFDSLFSPTRLKLKDPRVNRLEDLSLFITIYELFRWSEGRLHRGDYRLREAYRFTSSYIPAFPGFFHSCSHITAHIFP